ncbi:TetR/AcrR family transcriptional regulator [Ruegeria pomeroyi]|uniref:TetR/AcrR family transcriptional regulator n=1 Tax=Ruegeria alba TaxID=2916756 RepID=A0ABS9P1I7_9RHOB|nr:TetR/AcrR family transcriptional regulator [Ruegeria alba]MCE8514820.1 TetR/AcrR family transcriptional regulator [Ruegeria pomeroyi]MCE8523438.1 TetR/AcrR family transcriptional regulator [Ruegeria pomeroyi]MCE8527451.1 TetR/AcrR family transcriptional regulator [Ruegeria pomeroyi]MCE8530882.1 TetR/AcrR family transcriptional regulator [Ruegeria pomeroyi]MCE8534235.1 TetR/AcrR family transcriptional regulator [Ruegeria pomeroyi]
MTQASTILRTGRKFGQVLRGARDVFMNDGFEGANVDDIARAAGVSKATLYSYFPDKRLLFVEVAQNECQLMAERILSMIDETRPAREVLTITATQLVAFLISDFAQQVFRICLAERERFPELARAFYAAGPENGQRQICEYLEKAVAKGELEIDDIPMAAEQFSELCKTRLWTRAVFGIQTRFTKSEIDDVALAAVDTFLARYGA